ncbi:MAG: hypothetical protein IT454_12000 [Planctomycetes bacterium]|nr:hypothetical protein [Planctomycetota bacterium]
MAKNSTGPLKLLALVLIVPAVVTVVVGVDYTLRGLGFDLIEIRIPRSGGWALFVGLCCLGTGWVAKQGLTALWKKL